MNKVTHFFRESFNELGKVTWPTLPEALKMSAIVIGLSVVMGLLLTGADWLFTLTLEKSLEVAEQQTTTTVPQTLPISPEDIQVETTPAT